MSDSASNVVQVLHDKVFHSGTIYCFIKEGCIGPSRPRFDDSISDLSSFCDDDFLLGPVISTRCLVVAKILPGCEYIFRGDWDGVSIGCCERNLVVVMML